MTRSELLERLDRVRVQEGVIGTELDALITDIREHGVLDVQAPQDIIESMNLPAFPHSIKVTRFLDCIAHPYEAITALDAVHDSSRFNRGAKQFADRKLERTRNGDDDEAWLAAFAEGMDRMLASAMIANT